MASHKTAKRDKYIEGIRMGMHQVEAAKRAGYANPQMQASRMEAKDPVVIQARKEVTAENQKMAKMNRQKVFDLIQEGLDMARKADDVQAFFRGVQEINKMCGYYEPEKHEVLHTHEGEVVVRKIESMSDQQLLEHIGGESGLVIEGEVTGKT